MRRLALLATVLVSGSLAADTLCSLGDLQRVISVEYESNAIAVPCQVRYEKINEGEIAILGGLKGRWAIVKRAPTR